MRALVEAGHAVRVLDNNSRGALRRLEDVLDDVEIIEADIRDPAAVRTASKGVAEIIHMAFVNGTQYFYDRPELVLDVGVRGMLNVLDACRSEGVARLVLISSSETYQDPPVIPTPEDVPLVVPDVLNPRYSYGGGKLISELLAINWGRKGFERVLVVRPHNVYGPDMGFEHVIPQFAFRMMDLAEACPVGALVFPIKGNGSQTRAFCAIADFTDGLLLLLEKGSHLSIYNIGNPQEVTISELASLVAAQFGREIEVQAGESFSGETLRRCPDISKIAAMGYKPGIMLEKGLGPTLDWYRANRHLHADRPAPA